MLPIPRALLIHKATIKGEEMSNEWGEIIATDSIDLTSIRLEPTSTVITTKNNQQLQLSAVLFYDCKYSEPKNQAFAEDTVITFNGKGYTVKTVEELYDEKGLHHIELGLIL